MNKIVFALLLAGVIFLIGITEKAYSIDLASSDYCMIKKQIASGGSDAVAKIYNNTILWHQGSGLSNNPGYIHIYDIPTEQETTISGGGLFSIYKNIIFYTIYDSGLGSDIFIYNTSSGVSTKIVDDPYSSNSSYGIYGDVLAFGRYGVYIYNLSSSSIRTVAGEGSQNSNKIKIAAYKNILAWEDGRNWATSGTDIYMYDLASNQETQVTIVLLATFDNIPEFL